MLPLPRLAGGGWGEGAFILGAPVLARPETIKNTGSSLGIGLCRGF